MYKYMYKYMCVNLFLVEVLSTTAHPLSVIHMFQEKLLSVASKLRSAKTDKAIYVMFATCIVCKHTHLYSTLLITF